MWCNSERGLRASLTSHHISKKILGHSQAVRQQTLTLSCVGSNPAAPTNTRWLCGQLQSDLCKCRRAALHNIWTQLSWQSAAKHNGQRRSLVRVQPFRPSEICFIAYGCICVQSYSPISSYLPCYRACLCFCGVPLRPRTYLCKILWL